MKFAICNMNRKNCIIKRCRKKYLRKFNVHSEMKGNILNILRYLQRKNNKYHSSYVNFGKFFLCSQEQDKSAHYHHFYSTVTRGASKYSTLWQEVTLRSRHRQRVTDLVKGGTPEERPQQSFQRVLAQRSYRQNASGKKWRMLGMEVEQSVLPTSLR